ncbi:trace amine-associated receptor 4-like [Gastrophryne carolinensis]
MNSSELWSNQNLDVCLQILNSSCLKSNRSALSYWAMLIFMLCVVFVTVVGNLLVIISVSHFKLLHKSTNFLILSLAIADCLVGLVVMPYSMVRSVTSCWYFGHFFCKLHTCFDIMLCTSSIFHLFFISVDRYYAICHPLHYCRKITTVVVKVFLLVSWAGPGLYSCGLILSNIHMEGIQDKVSVSSCDWSCTLVLNKLWGAISAVICFFIPGLLMISVYMHIYFIARKHVNAISNSTIHLYEQQSTCTKTYMKLENKAARTLSLVMGVFILCWLPFFTFTIVDPYLHFATSKDVYNAVLWLGYFNSALNPIIYAFFYPRFKKAFECILTGKIFHLGSSFLQVI